MINNFNLLSEFIKPNDSLLTEDNFYFLQLIRRSKDTEGLPSKTIRDFYIKNSEDLLARKDEIIEMANFFNARAYFNPMPKSYEKCGLYMLKNMGDMFTNKSFKQAKGMFTSAAGQVSTRDSRFEKIWIIDYDKDEEPGSIDIMLYLKRRQLDYNLIATKNGLHYLVKPFDTRDCYFADKIQKNSPTLLYVKE